MGVRKVGKYTVLERQRAVETTIRLGRAAASLELGIPKGTLSCWAFLSRHGAGLVGGPLAFGAIGSVAGFGPAYLMAAAVALFGVTVLPRSETPRLKSESKAD